MPALGAHRYVFLAKADRLKGLNGPDIFGWANAKSFVPVDAVKAQAQSGPKKTYESYTRSIGIHLVQCIGIFLNCVGS